MFNWSASSHQPRSGLSSASSTNTPPRRATAPSTAGARLGACAGALLLLHVAFGLARVPHAVVVKRWREVAACREEGDAAFILRTAHLTGAEAIAMLRNTTPENAVIAVRGEDKGVLEFAPPLLWPRLCKAEGALPAGAVSAEGRPIAPMVLVAEGKHLRLEAR